MMGLWTAAHGKTLLPAVAVMIVLGVILHRFMADKEEKIRLIPLKIVGVLLLLLELGKQVLSLIRGYDLYHLPFHFCSLFIFMVPLMAFYNGRHKRSVRCITASITASLFILMLIYPCLIYSEGNIQNFFADFFSFHTVAFHNLVMFAFVLILMLDLHIPGGKGETKAVMWFVAGFCVVSASMAHILKTNYANYYTCNIPVFETIRLAVQNSLGYVAAQLVYVLIVSALNFAFVYGALWAYRGLQRLLGKKPVTV